MKTLLLFLLLIPLNISAQNTLSAIFSNGDYGVGLRYDRQFENYGGYASVRYGAYNASVCGQIEHYKTAVGIIGYTSTIDDYGVMFSAGLSGHYYNVINEGTEDVSWRALAPVSFEIGTGCIIKWFNAGFVYDPIKRDLEVNFGYTF